MLMKNYTVVFEEYIHIYFKQEFLPYELCLASEQLYLGN